MRKSKRLYFAGGLTLVMALAFAGVSSATHEPGGVQAADVFFTKTGKTTSKGTVGTLDIRLGKETDDPNTADPVPEKATQVRVDLSKDITVDGSPFPECTTAQLEGLEPAAAQAACGNTAPKSKNALLATGDATAQIGTTELAANSLAFNGPNGAVIVYARVEAISTTTIVPCQLGPAPDQSKFKTRFTCDVPPLAGGAGALTSFNLKFDRVEKKVKKKKNGKKKKTFNSIVFGKCPSTGVFNFAVSWDYSDHPSETREITQSC
jgi:hypothetical protein